MNTDRPIIHIIGLPGAGKSTLARYIGERLHIPSFCIGYFRSKHSQSCLGEIGAWRELKRNLSDRGYRNTILETTGLNRMESIMITDQRFKKRFVIKLCATKETLYKRIGMKPPDERGGKWLFSKIYPDKYTFVDKLYDNFSKLKSDVRITTDKLTPDQVGRSAVRFIETLRRTK